VHIPNDLETLMVIGKPAPFVRAFVDAVANARHGFLYIYAE